MPLPDVSLNRQDNLLNRVAPIFDRVVGLVITGVAVATKIALGECKRIYSTAELTALGIDGANNPFALAEIKDYYAQAGEGKELYFVLVSDATNMADTCDPANNVAKKLLDYSTGRITLLFVAKKLPAGYVSAKTGGLETDVWNAITKMQALAVQYDGLNQPFVGFLPGIGYTKAAMNALTDVGTLNNAFVAAPVLAAMDNTGRIGMGNLAGWLVRNQAHHNIGRVASGAVVQAGFFPDGTAINEYSLAQLGAIHDKRYILFRPVTQKAGYFYNDDPSCISVASDFSSVSWNQVINKAKRLAYGVLVEKLNDDVDTDPATGQIAASVASDWEGDVENSIRKQMIATKQITAVKCTIIRDAADVSSDQVKAQLRIVRKGQAKTISVEIGFADSV